MTFIFKSHGKHYFTSDAYLHISLDGESQRLTTINTHKGLLMYTPLCFGIASSAGVFRRIIDQLIHGISKKVAYFDDILFTEQFMEEHNSNLNAVLKRL